MHNDDRTSATPDTLISGSLNVILKQSSFLKKNLKKLLVGLISVTAPISVGGNLYQRTQVNHYQNQIALSDSLIANLLEQRVAVPHPTNSGAYITMTKSEYEAMQAKKKTREPNYKRGDRSKKK